MSADTYQPRPGSLAYAVACFFKAAPDEELRGPDIAAKWPTTNSARHAALGALEDADYITSRREGVTNIYSAGPALRDWQPEPEAKQPAAASTAAPPASPRAAPPAPARLRPQLPPVDLASITIEEGIPARSRFCVAGQGKYDELLDKLDTPGKSFTLPRAYAGAMDKACRSYAKVRASTQPGLKFRVNRISATECRVHRLA